VQLSLTVHPVTAARGNRAKSAFWRVAGFGSLDYARQTSSRQVRFALATAQMQGMLTTCMQADCPDTICLTDISPQLTEPDCMRL